MAGTGSYLLATLSIDAMALPIRYLVRGARRLLACKYYPVSSSLLSSW